MKDRKMKPIAAAIGTAFALSMTAGAVADEANPFEAQLIEDGTLLAAGHKEGGCGEDKDSDAPHAEGEEAKCGEGHGEGHGEGQGEGDEAEADGAEKGSDEE